MRPTILSCSMVLAASLVGVSCGPPPQTCSPTLTDINDKTFKVTCTLTACHSAQAGAAVGTLNLVTDPYHALLGANGTGATAVNPQGYPYDYTGKLLVKPSDPANSLLYLKVSGSGTGAPGCTASQCPNGEQMPYASQALPQTYVQCIHDWIQSGAQNN